MGLNKCCFWVDLRIGALISGYLVLVYNIAMLVMRIVTSYTVFVMMGYRDRAYQRRTLYSMSTIVMLVLGVVEILKLLFTIPLLVGLHKNKPRPVLTFIIANSFFLVVELVTSSLLLYSYASMYGLGQWIPAIFHYLSLIIYVYFLCVFGSYRSKMNEEGGGGKSTYYA